MTTALAARLILVVLCSAGCPRRFDPGTGPKLPEAATDESKARFAAAKSRFDEREFDVAAREMAAIRHDYPDDPIAPYAALYEGMAAYERGDHVGAAAALGPLTSDPKVDKDVAQRARFYLGLTDVQLGKPAEARALLEPFVGRVAEGDESVELTAALAEAQAQDGDAEAAIRSYDKFYGDARPAEQAYIAARVDTLVAGLSTEAARRVYGEVDKGRPAAAFLAEKLASAARAEGDQAGAQRILDETRDARAALGRVDETAVPAPGDSQVVGVVLPLSGKKRLVGEAALRGAAVAAGTYDGTGKGASSGMPLPFQVTVRDSGEGSEQAGAAIDDLYGEDAVAVIGPVDKDAAQAAALRADALGLPLVTLDVADEPVGEGSPFVFRAVISVEDRARALARYADKKGAKSYAILRPEMGYGERAANAFRDEVERLGGNVVVEVTYDKDATAFVKPVDALAKKKFDTLFIPDTAARLELVAPQLAVANLVVKAPSDRKPKRGRGILLLATAEAVTAKFLKGSGRYTSGAVLAPGFYPDDKDAPIGPFLTRFRRAYEEEPTYLDAYAYDAALAVRAAVENGAKSREAVAAAIASDEPLPGLTGDIRFGAAHTRADDGVLYSVVPEGADYVIHALRAP